MLVQAQLCGLKRQDAAGPGLQREVTYSAPSESLDAQSCSRCSEAGGRGWSWRAAETANQ